MFLHLVDDEKFIDSMIMQFERCDPGNHEFVLIPRKTTGAFHYLKKTDKIKVISWQSGARRLLQENLPDYTAVFLHGLFNPYYVDIVNAAARETVFVWMFWGGELLTFKHYQNSLLLPETRLLLFKNRMAHVAAANWRKYGGMIQRGQIGAMWRSLASAAERQKKAFSSGPKDALTAAIKRMDYIVPVIEDDFQLLQNWFSLRAKILTWNYAIGISLDNFERKIAHEGNWLVGNSAHYTNNHVEIFRRLKKIKSHSGKIIVPLSYGDSQYQADIIRFGRQSFKERFVPLNEFLAYKSYLDVLCSCSAAFFNTRRQQGMGNIGLLLTLGVKVFLRQENPVYQFLRRKGAIVFCIQTDIPKYTEAINKPLDEWSAQQNRAVMMQMASEDVLRDRTITMLRILKESAGH